MRHSSQTIKCLIRSVSKQLSSHLPAFSFLSLNLYFTSATLKCIMIFSPEFPMYKSSNRLNYYWQWNDNGISDNGDKDRNLRYRLTRAALLSSSIWWQVDHFAHPFTSYKNCSKKKFEMIWGGGSNLECSSCGCHVNDLLIDRSMNWFVVFNRLIFFNILQSTVFLHLNFCNFKWRNWDDQIINSFPLSSNQLIVWK